MALPMKLRVLRARAGLTLVHAAEKIGVGRDTLSDLEKGRRHPIMPTIRAIADAYGVPVEELLEGEPSEELTAQEWAKRQNARLHGMTSEEWDDYVRAHDTKDGLTETWKEIHDEARMLHAAWAMEKWQRPQERERRRKLAQGLHELRMGRYADLQARAMLLHAQALVDEIFAAMKEEAAQS